MTRAHIAAIAALTLLASGTILSADPAPDPGVPFGCDAAKGATCFFKLYIGPRATRIVQLTSGMKVNIPGLTVGQTKYCVSLNQAPVASCERIAVDPTYNH
jgi:hypothetical protein